MLETDIHAGIARWAAEQGILWQRLEVPMFPGIPDGYLGRPISTWIETKIVTSTMSRPDYRRGQLPWALSASKEGEICLTVCGILSGPGPGWFAALDTAAAARAVALGLDWPPWLYLGPRLDHLCDWIKGFSCSGS